MFEIVTEPARQTVRPVKKIIVHVSDSPDSMDVGAKEINEWHVQRGWYCIGYHYVIRRSGAVEKGRDDAMVGSHTLGQNHDSLGVVWVGRDHMAMEQEVALVKLVKELMGLYKLPMSAVYGHREFNKGKTCPNIDPDTIRSWLK